MSVTPSTVSPIEGPPDSTVKESNEYEVVNSIPEMSDIIDTTSEGITKYLAYLSNDAISQTIIRLNQELKSSLNELENSLSAYDSAIEALNKWASFLSQIISQYHMSWALLCVGDTEMDKVVQ